MWLARGTCIKEVVCRLVCFFSVGSITVYLSKLASSLNDMSVSMALFIRQMKQGKIFSIFAMKKNKRKVNLLWLLQLSRNNVTQLSSEQYFHYLTPSNDLIFFCNFEVVWQCMALFDFIS